MLLLVFDCVYFQVVGACLYYVKWLCLNCDCGLTYYMLKDIFDSGT